MDRFRGLASLPRLGLDGGLCEKEMIGPKHTVCAFPLQWQPLLLVKASFVGLRLRALAGSIKKLWQIGVECCFAALLIHGYGSHYTLSVEMS